MTEYRAPQIVTYPEYIEMIENVAEEFGVLQSDFGKIREQFPFPVPEPRTGAGDVTFTLEVEDRYSINWSGTGKVFEIIGPNMRNKTTSLVYTATLLGFDWDSMEPYLEDKKLIRQAKNVQQLLSTGVNVHLIVEDSLHRLVIEISNGLATLALWEKEGNNRKMHFVDLSLERPGDWAEYRERVNGLFDVQFVGKGRNFIAQVGFEEASNLSAFCWYIANTVEGYNRLLVQNAVGKNPDDLRRNIEELEMKFVSLLAEKRDVQDLLVTTKGRVQQLSDDLTAIRNDLNNEGIKRYLELEIKLDGLQLIQTKLNGKCARLEVVQTEIANIEESIETNSEYFERIASLVDHLCILFSGIKDEIALPDTDIEVFAAGLRDGNVDIIIDFLEDLRIDSSTVGAHKELGQFNAPAISVDTKLIGINVFNQPAPSLRVFRDYVREAGKTASLLGSLQDTIENLIDVLALIGIQQSGDFAMMKGLFEETCASLQEGLREKSGLERAVGDLTEELSKKLGQYMSVGSIVEQREALAGYIDIEQYRDLVSRIQTWEDDLTFDVEERLLSRLEGLKEEMDTLSQRENRLQRQLRKVEHEIEANRRQLDDTADIEVLYERIAALRSFRDFLMDVHEYFLYKRLAFEQRDVEAVLSEQNLELAQNNQQNLGERFASIIAMINERIRKRCPFAYVNDVSVVKKKVRFYDFLQEDFHIDGLDEGAKQHGGITSSMTVYGLATRNSGKMFGAVLLVDEWGDAGVYADKIFEELAIIPHLSFCIFVDVDSDRSDTSFEVRR